MDWTRPATVSGGHRPQVVSAPVTHASPVVLRLLPHVPHPPARVAVCGPHASGDGPALRARGYRVEAGPANADAAMGWHPEAPLDAVCDGGLLRTVPLAARPRWAALMALHLRPGGRLFGAFATGDAPGAIGASELSALLGGSFDVERLTESAFTDDDGAPLLEAVFTRR
jgi:hypothetical protein